jgi:ribonuclease P protein component
VAATRKLGSAVIRNRAKRLARELFRREKPPAGLDVILVPRREMLDAPFASLEVDYATTTCPTRP